MALTQLQHYELARRRNAEINEHFMSMVTDKDNPLTSTDLRTMIEKYPYRWERFANFIPTLEAREVAQ
jgi:Ca2+-binding EF-hand superfamily protein